MPTYEKGGEGTSRRLLVMRLGDFLLSLGSSLLSPVLFLPPLACPNLQCDDAAILLSCTVHMSLLSLSFLFLCCLTMSSPLPLHPLQPSSPSPNSIKLSSLSPTSKNPPRFPSRLLSIRFNDGFSENLRSGTRSLR